MTLSRRSVLKLGVSAGAIPADVVAGKDRVTVRFQAREGRWIATVFGVRLIRADAPR